jgi:hypothetical protein
MKRTRNIVTVLQLHILNKVNEVFKNYKFDDFKSILASHFIEIIVCVTENLHDKEISKDILVNNTINIYNTLQETISDWRQKAEIFAEILYAVQSALYSSKMPKSDVKCIFQLIGMTFAVYATQANDTNDTIEHECCW